MKSSGEGCCRPLGRSGAPHTDPVAELSIAELGRRMSSGRLTAEAITQAGEGDRRHDVPCKDFIGKDAVQRDLEILGVLTRPRLRQCTVLCADGSEF